MARISDFEDANARLVGQFIDLFNDSVFGGVHYENVLLHTSQPGFGGEPIPGATYDGQSMSGLWIDTIPGYPRHEYIAIAMGHPSDNDIAACGVLTRQAILRSSIGPVALSKMTTNTLQAIDQITAPSSAAAFDALKEECRVFEVPLAAWFVARVVERPDLRHLYMWYPAHASVPQDILGYAKERLRYMDELGC